MMISRIIYMMLLIAAISFYPLYEDELSLMVMVSLIVLPVLLLADLIVKAGKCRVVCPEDAVVHKGEHTLRIKTVNGGISPVSKADMDISVSYLPFGEREDLSDCVSVPSRGSAAVMQELVMDSYGAADIRVERIRIHDLLGLFTWRRKEDASVRYTCIPDVDESYREAAEQIEMLISGETDGAEIPTTSPGDVIDFRDFHPGDRLTLVHHKLSARFDKDIVKIMGAGREPSVCIAADISRDRDRVLEECYNILFFLAQLGTDVHMMLPEGIVPVGTDTLDGIFCRAVTEKTLPTDTASAMTVIVIGGDDDDR